MKILIVGALALLMAYGQPASAAGGAAPEAVLQQLQQSTAGVRTLSSDFVQEKHLKIFKNVVTSKGRFYFSAPDQLRWELTSPVASGFVIKGEKGRRWNERTGRTETFRISEEPVMKLVAEQLLAWAAGNFTRIQREYRVKVLDDSPVFLRLEPVSAATAGYLNHLLVNFSPDGRYVRSVEVHEQDGDFTRIRFVNAAVNKPLKADLF